MEGLHSVRVHVKNTTFVVDAVPYGVTAGELLHALRSIDITSQPKMDTKIQVEGTILKPEDTLNASEIDIVFRRSGGLRLWGSLLLLIVWGAAHAFPIPVFRSSITKGILCYLGFLFVFVALYLIVKPQGTVFSDVMRINTRSNIVIELIWIFLRTLSPTFHLEEMLIRDED